MSEEEFSAEEIDEYLYEEYLYFEYKDKLEEANKEIENLNNIINELEKWLEENIKQKPLLTTYFFKCDGKERSISGIELEELKRVLNKLKELKEGNKDE